MTYQTVLITEKGKYLVGLKRLPLLAKGIAIDIPGTGLRRITDVWVALTDDGEIAKVTYFLGTKEVA